MSSDVGWHIKDKLWQSRSMVQCCFTFTETVRLTRTESPGGPPRLSHSSWTLQDKVSPSSRLMYIHTYKYSDNVLLHTSTVPNSYYTQVQCQSGYYTQGFLLFSVVDNLCLCCLFGWQTGMAWSVKVLLTPLIDWALYLYKRKQSLAHSLLF